MSATCQRSFSLTVNDACPDWTQLIAPEPTFPQVTAVQSSFTPLAGDMHSFVATITHGAFDPDARCWNAAKLTGYNKGACNCNLHVVWSISNPVAFFSAGLFFNVDGPSINFALLPSGTYNYPFTLHSGVVTPYDIIVTVTLDAAQLGFQANNMSLTGVITNV